MATLPDFNSNDSQLTALLQALGQSNTGQQSPLNNGLNSTGTDALSKALQQIAGQNKFGMNLGTIGTVASALGSLGGLYTGIGSLNQAKKQFNFTRDLTNRNLSNQAITTNNALENQARNRLSGGLDGQALIDAVNSYLSTRKVNGGPV